MAELLPIMATSLGPQTLAPVFQQLFYEPLMKRLQAGQPDGVRSTMTGRSFEMQSMQKDTMACCGIHDVKAVVHDVTSTLGT